MAELLFLGTGASSGIPMIGCSCAVCTSNDPRNQRLRPSALLTLDGKKILIDAGPDFRAQALNYHIDHLDGVLLTHSHFDHVAGLDELRIYYLRTRQNLPLLLSEATMQDLQRRYDYLFRAKQAHSSLTAQLDFHILKGERGATTFLELPIRYLSYEQGGMPVTGFLCGKLAYLSDLKHYPETVFDDLEGIDILVLSALRAKESLMHLTIEEAVAFAQKTGAKQTYLTHLGHEVDHTTLKLPPGVQLAYDGLKVEFPYG